MIVLGEKKNEKQTGENVVDTEIDKLNDKKNIG